MRPQVPQSLVRGYLKVATLIFLLFAVDLCGTPTSWLYDPLPPSDSRLPHVRTPGFSSFCLSDSPTFCLHDPSTFCLRRSPTSDLMASYFLTLRESGHRPAPTHPGTTRLRQHLHQAIVNPRFHHAPLLTNHLLPLGLARNRQQRKAGFLSIPRGLVQPKNGECS